MVEEFREINTGCIKKNRNLGDFSCFFEPKFFSKMALLGLILCGEIDCAHFQRFPDPESGNRNVCIEAKIENF